MSLIKLRKLTSVAVLILFTGLFLGTGTLSGFLAKILLPLQLMPALIRTITRPDVLFAAGLIFIVVITFVFGRVYCSFLCPLGALQDLVIAGSRRIGRRTRHTYSRPLNAMRYMLLGLTLLFLIFGILAPVNLLDPYSVAGRIFSSILQPLIVGIYNLGILALKPFNIYLYPKDTAIVPLPVLAVTFFFFLLIAYLAATRGRLYCNSICPAGTLLGWIARHSLFQFRLNRNTCSECVRCASVCKAGCINPQDGSIDMNRCIGCFNCLDACSADAVSYRRSPARARANAWSPARRRFVVGGLAATAGLLAFSGKVRSFLSVPSANAANADLPVTPPGSVSSSRFTSACTACALCVSVCPTRVLTPSFLDFGLAGLLQPKMNYEKSFCEYECNLCGRVCPTGAILPLLPGEKKLTQIGEAKLLEDVCVVFVDHRNCGACGEVCPTHAIRFTDKKNILYPEIDTKYCIGCGACQLACPTSPRSIIVHPRPVHGKAEKNDRPETPPVKPGKPADKDFPF